MSVVGFVRYFIIVRPLRVSAASIQAPASISGIYLIAVGEIVGWFWVCSVGGQNMFGDGRKERLGPAEGSMAACILPPEACFIPPIFCYFSFLAASSHLKGVFLLLRGGCTRSGLEHGGCGFVSRLYISLYQVDEYDPVGSVGWHR